MTGVTDGILDNEVWKTILSGQNSYNNIPPAFGPGTMFHGSIEVNFHNSYTYSYTLNSAVSNASELDFYTIILHEAFHLLGFTSNIDDDGLSRIANTNLFHRFDLFLQSQVNGPNPTALINHTNCYAVTSQATALDPVIGCITPVLFNGPNNQNQVVHSPSGWMSGSSLSHFECNGGTGCPANWNQNEYIMLPCLNPGPGWDKRNPAPEEAQTLCDLGYTTRATWSDPMTNHTGYCPGCYTPCGPACQPVGVHDRFDSNGDQFVIANSNPARDIVIPFTDLTANDISNMGAGSQFINPTCFEIVTPGLAQNGVLFVNPIPGQITYTAPAGFQGWVVLSYIPACVGGGRRGGKYYVCVCFCGIDPNTLSASKGL